MRNISIVIIEKPIGQVWDFYLDPSNFNLWLSAFSSIETINGQWGELNSVIKHHYEHKGKKMILSETISELVYHSTIKTIQENNLLKTDLLLQFENLDSNSTKLIAIANTKFKLIHFKFLSFFLHKSFQQRLDNDFFRLKEIMEKSN